MTRKDFELIAAGVRRALSEAQSNDERLGVRNAAGRIATQLVSTNPRFDRDRFLLACFDL